VAPDAFEELFDRERLLAGLPARRANTLLFLIESRTARLTAQSRQAMARFATRDSAQQRELAFIEAFALGREPPLRPTIQDLELQAPRWASLVARNPRVQAALAHRLGEKYRLARGRVGAIREALGLDDPLVGAAYERLYSRPIDSIYVDRPPLGERLRWARAGVRGRLEGLSPFWTAYALTLTETVGSTIVALPIAVAAIGPMPAVAILVLLGLVNVLTVAFMADALTRSAAIRYGDAYIGRVVAELLGRSGAIVLTVGLVGICLMGMQADYIGVSSTLTDATGVPALGWVAALFAVELLILRRGSIDATVTSALVVGALNITLILAVCALAFWHVEPSNLTHVSLPFSGDEGFDRSSLALVFGVTFTAFFGHLSVSNCARVVLGRDPGGRTLVRGVVAAQLTAIFLYVLFVVAVTGAVSPDALVRETGTALSPLADEAGPAVLALGEILVVLGMGMASVHSALALFYLVRERLPSRAPLTLVLPRRGARIVLTARGRGDGRTVALTYLGLDRGAARVRFDLGSRAAPGSGDAPPRSVEATATAGPWEPFGAAPLRELGEAGHELVVDVLSASDHELRAELSTSMRLRYEGEYDSAGVSLSAILELPDREAEVLALVLRRTDASAAQIAALVDVDPAVASDLLSSLSERGLVSETVRGGERRYVARAGRRRGGRLPAGVWDALKGPDDEGEAPTSTAGDTARRGGGRGRHRAAPGEREAAARGSGAGPASGTVAAGGRRGEIAARAARLLAGDRARFLAGVSPVAAVFAFAAWQSTTDAISLADVLSFLGVIIVALLAGVFPVLLLVAARNRGELLPSGYRLPAARWVLVGVYVVALGGVALHGLVLWEDPLQRACALAVTALALGMTVSMVRRGTFAPRATIELRHVDDDEGATFAVVCAGQPAIADVVLEYDGGDEVRVRAAAGDVPRFAALRRMTIAPDWTGVATIPAALRVWAHRVTAEEDSVALDVTIEGASEDAPFSVAGEGDGATIIAVDARSPTVVVRFGDDSP
jgi:hypothetical protein